MTFVHVAADDRTGALEVAGACADACRIPVSVRVGASNDASVADDRSVIEVVDLATRHLPAGAAASTAALVDRTVVTPPTAVQGGPVLAHKIDSTLRGNWAYELVARQRANGRRVLVVPAFPAVGRRCELGVVTVHGVPVAQGAAAVDARAPVRTSRPAVMLREAGASAVTEVRGGVALDAWLAGGTTFAVCDASTDDDLEAIASAWAVHAGEVLIAGTAGSIAAAVAALALGGGEDAGGADGRVPRLELPALVVCGSLHPTARAQVRALIDHANPAVTVLASPEPERVPVAPDDAAQAAAALADAARAVIADGRHRTVLVIGGDTAAAVLGDAAVVVGGTVAAGMPWLRLAAADGPVFVTKAGGFGDAGSLTDLLLERTTG